MDIRFTENGIYVWIQAEQGAPARLKHLGAQAGIGEGAGSPLAALRLAGEDSAPGFEETTLGGRLRYTHHEAARDERGMTLSITQRAGDVSVMTHLRFWSGVPCVSCHAEVLNDSADTLGLLSLASFTQALPDYQEAGWRVRTPGASETKPGLSAGAPGMQGAALPPIASIERKDGGMALMLEIETPCTWHWQIEPEGGHPRLSAFGPSFAGHGFARALRPGERFESVACTVCWVQGGFEEAAQAMARYHRAARQGALPPKYRAGYEAGLGDLAAGAGAPALDAAARLGAEVFLLHGWGEPPETLGEWRGDLRRLPEELPPLIREIRARGMIPGLSLQIDAVGAASPLAQSVPDGWFFRRYGRRVVYGGQHPLDYRHPGVLHHMDKVIGTLAELGAGYLSLDRAIDGGDGTEVLADSPGDGLLRHARAYQAWLQRIAARYPELAFEIRGQDALPMPPPGAPPWPLRRIAGRADAQLGPVLAVNALGAQLPEEAVMPIWLDAAVAAEPGGLERTAFSMAAAVFMRPMLLGDIAKLPPEVAGLVRGAISLGAELAGEVAGALPIWPIGPASPGDEYACVGMECEKRVHLCIWRTDGESGSATLPVRRALGHKANAKPRYPQRAPVSFLWDMERAQLTVTLPPYSARVFTIEIA